MSLEKIMDAALAEAGASQFVDTSFVRPMNEFVQLRNTLTDAGQTWQREMIQRWLVNRLRFERDVARHPEILDEDVSDPIVVLGLARSGTTAFQRILAADDSVRTVRWWQALNPAPFDGEGTHESHLRLAFAERQVDALHTNNPDFKTVHPLRADDADEDTYFHIMTGRAIQGFSFAPWSADYLAYLQSQPREPVYAYVANIYRYLQWQDGGKQGRPWVMKSPTHTGAIEAILAAHPKATFVLLTRDYPSVFASTCKLFEITYKGIFRDQDPQALGRVQLQIWSEELRRLGKARRALGKKLKFVEISYEQMLTDPVASARTVFELADREFTSRIERSIQGWIGDNPRGKHGLARYRLEDYGVTAAQVEATFTAALNGEAVH